VSLRGRLWACIAGATSANQFHVNIMIKMQDSSHMDCWRSGSASDSRHGNTRRSSVQIGYGSFVLLVRRTSSRRTWCIVHLQYSFWVRSVNKVSQVLSFVWSPMLDLVPASENSGKVKVHECMKRTIAILLRFVQDPVCFAKASTVPDNGSFSEGATVKAHPSDYSHRQRLNIPQRLLHRSDISIAIPNTHIPPVRLFISRRHHRLDNSIPIRIEEERDRNPRRVGEVDHAVSGGFVGAAGPFGEHVAEVAEEGALDTIYQYGRIGWWSGWMKLTSIGSACIHSPVLLRTCSEPLVESAKRKVRMPKSAHVVSVKVGKAVFREVLTSVLSDTSFRRNRGRLSTVTDRPQLPERFIDSANKEFDIDTESESQSFDHSSTQTLHAVDVSFDCGAEGIGFGGPLIDALAYTTPAFGRCYRSIEVQSLMRSTYVNPAC